jgi:intracellular multiplication protein IcmK
MKKIFLSTFLIGIFINTTAISANKPSWVSANINTDDTEERAKVENLAEPQVTQQSTPSPEISQAPRQWFKANTNADNNNTKTNYSSSDYIVPHNNDIDDINENETYDVYDVNGVHDLPPLVPPTGYNISSYDQAKEMVSPLSSEEIKKLKKYYDKTRAAKYYQPTDTIPRISSVTADLSAGAALPVLRTMPYETSTLVFIDSTGAPWPLAAIPRVSNPDAFDVEWLADSASVIVSAKHSYQKGNLTVFLHGLATPVVIRLITNDEPRDKVKIVDYRLDVRVAGRGPNAGESIVGDNKIGLYDDVIQNFLDGLPPSDSIKVKFHGKPSLPVQIWKYKNALYVRTSLNIQNAFDQIISSGDGTKVYKIIETPFITFSDGDKKSVLQLEL